VPPVRRHRFETDPPTVRPANDPGLHVGVVSRLGRVASFAVASGTPATTAATGAGIDFQVHEYDHDAADTEYGAEAVARLGLDPQRVLKTLVVAVSDREHAVACVPVARKLDEKAFAACLAVKRVAMAEPDVAQRLTGYVLGGISPLGQKRRMRTVIDASAEGFPTVFVSAGRRGLEIELAPADLVRLTDAIVASIAKA
jgi:Cys-tRNA(Pro)/Cys-tRNA(Cys) deacylase